VLRSTFIALSRSKLIGGLLTGSRIAWRAAGRFVAGQTIDDAVSVVGRLNDSGLSATLDFLGENVGTRAEAEASAAAYERAIDAIRESGIDASISLKLTALGLDLGQQVAESLLESVLERAAQAEPALAVTVDMEGSDYTERTLQVFFALRARYPHVGTVIQSYLHRSQADVDRLVEAGARVRLVKGAYLEPESIAFQDKAEVDAALIRLVRTMLSDRALEAGAYLELGSHDEAIVDWTKAHAEERNIGRDGFEFQMLYGIRRDLQARLVQEGYRVRTYVPYGAQWYPYFMRRLAERPENIAFVARSVFREARA